MSEKVRQEAGLTRRSFLKSTLLAAGSAAALGVGGAGLAAGGANAEEGVKEKVFSGVCRGNCMGGCPLDVIVRDDKVVRVQAADCPDQRYKRICQKGMTHPQRIYSAERLLYPMKRIGERGSGEWERIGWEEAIGTITDKWKELRAQYGPGSIGWWCQSGSFGLLSGCHYFGAYTRLTSALQTVSISGAIDMNYYTANGAVYGGGLCSSSNEATDYANAKTLISWGSNLTEAQLHIWHFVADAIDNGCKLIVIDPSFTTIAAKADLFVPIRPGSDAILAMAMANIMIAEDLVDWDFVKKSSVGPFLVKEDGSYLRMSDLGQAVAGDMTDEILVWDEAANGATPASQAVNPLLEGAFEVAGFKVTPAFALLVERMAEWTPERASEMCEVPVEVMHQIVDLYTGNKPSSIFLGFGPDRYYNGHGAYTAIGAFAILSGNIGKPGASAGVCQYGGAPLDGAFCTSPIQADRIDTVGDGQASYTAGVLAHVLPEALETGMYNGQPFNVKSIFVSNCNPLNYVVDRQQLIKVFDQMELIVCTDIRPTDTTWYADIVLPVAHWFEVDDFTCGTAFNTPFVVLQEKAVEPPAECKSDYEIYKLLAEGMGMPGVYAGFSPEEAMRYVLDTETAAMWGVSYDRLVKEKIIRWFPEEDYIYGANGAFGSATGRVAFYFEKLAPSMQWGQEFDAELERLPHFVEPQEAWPTSELAKKYPLTCYQEHTRWRVHSNFSEVPWLREFDPEPTVKLNPIDAQARGIVSGDMVKVFNDRGHAVVKAIVSEGIKPGMCNMPKGWQADQYVSGHYQDLSSRGLNPYVANSQFSDLQVEIEKFEGDVR